MLQGLADLGLLQHFDYLSTVAGGGHIGGWFAAWVKREGDLTNVEKQLRPSRGAQAEACRPGIPRGLIIEEEPRTVSWLREETSRVDPRLGPSIVSWISTLRFLGNVLHYQLVLWLVAVLAAMAVRFVVAVYALHPSDWQAILFRCVLLLLGILALLHLCMPLVKPAMMRALFRNSPDTRGAPTNTPTSDSVGLGHIHPDRSLSGSSASRATGDSAGLRHFHTGIVLPLLVATVVTCGIWIRESQWGWPILFTGAAVYFGLIYAVLWNLGRPAVEATPAERWSRWATGFVLGVTGPRRRRG